MQGPNVKKLIAHKMSLDAIPSGGNFMDGVNFLLSPERVKAGARAATEWVEQAIAVMKTTPDNPYKTDEEIAGAILKGIADERTKRGVNLLRGQ